MSENRKFYLKYSKDFSIEKSQEEIKEHRRREVSKTTNGKNPEIFHISGPVLNKCIRKHLPTNEAVKRDISYSAAFAMADNPNAYHAVIENSNLSELAIAKVKIGMENVHSAQGTCKKIEKKHSESRGREIDYDEKQEEKEYNAMDVLSKMVNLTAGMINSLPSEDVLKIYETTQNITQKEASIYLPEIIYKSEKEHGLKADGFEFKNNTFVERSWVKENCVPVNREDMGKKETLLHRIFNKKQR